MARPNILFIMCDQLRQDYLSCYGHPSLRTPNIDSLAERGVRFTNAFCQAPLCGPSRASFYTGRYMSSHGAMANADPLHAAELTMGDYMGALDYRTALCGKSHTSINPQGLERLGMHRTSLMAERMACGGFEPWEVYEGLYPDQRLPDYVGYHEYLRSHGFDGDNPWETYVNAAQGDDSIASGWLMRNNVRPSRIPEQHSETAFVTNRGIQFIEDVGPGRNWCLHLSYIKPHWPLMAPSPYHHLYSASDIKPVLREDGERNNPHAVVAAFMQEEYSESYGRTEVREAVIPVYMGLIKQVDDQLGRLFDYLKLNNQWQNTLIIFTSDHGDYLGDHWLGEKDLFHDPSVKIPLIISGPETLVHGGKVEDALVEAIDLLPTMIEVAGGKIPRERLEGRSLLPLLGDARIIDQWRDMVVSEIDYSDRGARWRLVMPPYECRAWMLRSTKWKYIYYEGFEPQLFDLEKDPCEFKDLGTDSAHGSILRQMQDRLFKWLRQRKVRTEVPFSVLDTVKPEAEQDHGIIIGRW